jgi:hypothetical protein
MNATELAAITELRDMGATVMQIAEELGLDRLDVYGVVMRGKGDQPAPPGVLTDKAQYSTTADKATPDKEITTAHLLFTVNTALAHATRHTDKALDTQGTAREYNLVHVGRHLLEAVEHAQRLASHLKLKYPAEGKELQIIEDAATSPDKRRPSH